MEAFYVAFLVLRLQNGFIFGEFLFWCFLCKFENRDNQHLQIGLNPFTLDFFLNVFH